MKFEYYESITKWNKQSMSHGKQKSRDVREIDGCLRMKRKKQKLGDVTISLRCSHNHLIFDIPDCENEKKMRFTQINEIIGWVRNFVLISSTKFKVEAKNSDTAEILMWNPHFAFQFLSPAEMMDFPLYDCPHHRFSWNSLYVLWMIHMRKTYSLLTRLPPVHGTYRCVVGFSMICMFVNDHHSMPFISLYFVPHSHSFNHIFSLSSPHTGFQAGHSCLNALLMSCLCSIMMASWMKSRVSPCKCVSLACP